MRASRWRKTWPWRPCRNRHKRAARPRRQRQPRPGAFLRGHRGPDFSNGTLAGYHLGTVEVFPVHYDAATETSLFYPNVSIQVQTEASPDTSENGVQPLAADTQQVEAMVANPQEAAAYDASSLSARSGADGRILQPAQRGAL